MLVSQSQSRLRKTEDCYVRKGPASLTQEVFCSLLDLRSLVLLTGNNRKFMQSFEESAFRRLERIANERGVTLQELMRAVIIPEWLKKNSE